MTQQEKDLLLKVLCDGMPYGLVVEYKGKPYEILGYACGRLSLVKKYESRIAASPLIEEVKPYLRDMEDMTEHEQAEFSYFTYVEDNRYITTSLFEDATDWLNKNHFNWRGLPKERYIKVTKENNPYKE